jgi:cell division protein FtsB
MPLEPATKPAPKRATRGVEPLRRKRVQPEPIIVSPRGRRILNVILGFATVVMMVDALVGEKGLLARMRAREEYQKQFASVEALKNENAHLREKAARLRDDLSASEAIAREELGLLRDGEVLFIIRDSKPARDLAATSAGTGAVPAKATDQVK